MLLRAILLLAAVLFGMGQDRAAAAPPRIVMTWVPPYGIDASFTQLNQLYGGAGPRNTLTHLGLQFWIPTTSGGLRRDHYYGTITNARIQQFVTWGQANGVKVLLTVYNAIADEDPFDNDWDWNLAKNAFDTHKTTFINALVAEVEARGLDGVDVDLEGIVVATADDKAKYIAFIRSLRHQLRLRGKILTLDSFHYIHNAPNQTWWQELFPLVDAITSMGYDQLGVNAPDWQRYSEQKKVAGDYHRKLLIGMPSFASSWLGNTAPQHANWFLNVNSGRTGVGIWDAQFQAAAWQQALVWQRLKNLRAGTYPAAAPGPAQKFRVPKSVSAEVGAQ